MTFNTVHPGQIATALVRIRSTRAYSAVRERLGLVTATLAEDIQQRGAYQAVVAAQANFDRLMGRINEEIARGVADKAGHVVEAVNFARDIGNLPPNDCAPAQLASTALSLAQEYGMKARVIEAKGVADSLQLATRSAQFDMILRGPPSAQA